MTDDSRNLARQPRRVEATADDVIGPGEYEEDEHGVMDFYTLGWLNPGWSSAPPQGFAHHLKREREIRQDR